MTECFVHGASLFGPGLAGWEAARAVLRDGQPWEDAMPPLPSPAMLAPNERRRAGVPTRLALAVCEEAVAQSGRAAADFSCVFASSNGEGSIVNGLLEVLAGPDRLLSPTQFHNSVHNAVAGYWTIGTGSMQPVSCLAGHDETFASALLQAAAGVSAGRDTLLCVYDTPIPQPLGDGRPTAFGFACALVLSPTRSGAMTGLRISADFGKRGAVDLPRHAGVAGLVAGNAAAAGLRLFENLACGTGGPTVLALPGGRLVAECFPC